MLPAKTFLNFRRHWVSFLFLLPIFPLEAIYHARAVAERVPRVGGGPTDSLDEYHFTPFTSFLGSALFWVFWGGILAFAMHAVFIRQLGRGWLWAKLLFLPVYFVAAFLWSLHVE